MTHICPPYLYKQLLQVKAVVVVFCSFHRAKVFTYLKYVDCLPLNSMSCATIVEVLIYTETNHACTQSMFKCLDQQNLYTLVLLISSTHVALIYICLCSQHLT